MLKNALYFKTKEREKKNPELLPLFGSAQKVNGVYSVPRRFLPPGFCGNPFSSFLCNPADKPTNKQMDKGKNKTSLAELISI